MVDDLYRIEGQAELIDGKIVRNGPHGLRPGVVAGRIMRRLGDYADARGVGVSLTATAGYALPRRLPSGRESFSPDASYHHGPLPTNPMRFIDGSPTFAVEIRSDGDYGQSAEAEMADKRADYFQAGTLVVWDVDPVAGVIDFYRASDPRNPVRFAAGDTATAEPAVPGWQVAVDWVMRP
ncbi:MAG: Uma2 family endonuclease [Gemmataceae bacterium]